MLQHWVGSSPVCFGYLDSGRDIPVNDIQQTVGALINMLICNVQVDRHLPVGDILSSIHEDYQQSNRYGAGAPQALSSMKLTPPSEFLFNTLINYRKQSLSESSHTAGIVFDFLDGEDGMEVSSLTPCVFTKSHLTDL